MTEFSHYRVVTDAGGLEVTILDNDVELRSCLDDGEIVLVSLDLPHAEMLHLAHWIINQIEGDGA
jgi:hypothetical protein